MKSVIIKNGLLAGLIVTASFVLSFSFLPMDFEYGMLLGYASMLIAFSTIFFAVRSHRDQFLGGSISFGKALTIGLGITLIASVIYVAVWMIMSNTVAKDFMAEYFQHAVEKLKASDLSEAEINQKIADMEELKEMYKNPFVKIILTLREIFPTGLIVSLISAFILKRK